MRTSPPPPQQRRLGAKTFAITLAGLIGFTGIMSADSLDVVAETEANWTNAEYAQSSHVAAGELAPPQNLTCSEPTLVGQVTLHWDPPVDGPPEQYILEVRDGSDEDDISQHVLANQTTSRLMSLGLLGDLLGNLSDLGGTVDARIRATGPSEWEWVSSPTPWVTFTPALLGLVGATCD